MVDISGTVTVMPNAIDAAHIERQISFSEATFGPGTRLQGVIDHLRKELDEALANPEDVSEWADIIILAIDGAWRQGHSPQAILDAVEAKQTKNEGRDWPDWRSQPADKAIEHVRAAAPTATKRGTRLPEDWWPSRDVQAELGEKYPDLNLGMILEEFRDYWCAVPGSRGLKLSWDRTFRNRVREVAHKPQYRRQGISMRGGGQMSKVDAKAMSYLDE